MKKVFLSVGVLILLGMIFVSAVDEPSVGIGAEDAAKLQEGIEKYSPLDESGEIDYGKYQPFVTKAEMRLDAINQWLEDNAAWMKVVFGMVPSLTWLFAFNIWIWLWFLVFLVLNSDVTLGWISFLTERKIVTPGTFRVRKDKVAGILLFLIVVILKYNVALAQVGLNLFSALWNYVLPIGIGLLVIVIVLFAVIAYFSFPLALQIVRSIRQIVEARREARAKKRQDLNREVLERVASGVTRDEFA